MARSSACCSSAGLDPTLANIIQALLYTLTTRLGAPGRDRYLLVLTLGIGLIGGWLTVATGGIAAAFLGHAITRFAVFLCTGHTGPDEAARPRGRGDRQAPPTARGLAGHRVAGVASQGSDEPRPCAVGSRDPPVALYIHIPFCVSLCPYCDFVVYRRGRRAWPAEPDRAFLDGAARRARAAGRRA